MFNIFIRKTRTQDTLSQCRTLQETTSDTKTLGLPAHTQDTHRPVHLGDSQQSLEDTTEALSRKHTRLPGRSAIQINNRRLEAHTATANMYMSKPAGFLRAQK